MEGGCKLQHNEPLAKDEFEDEMGNIFRHNPIADDPRLAELVHALPTLGRSNVSIPGETSTKVRCRRPVGSTRGKCGKCGGWGYNKKTFSVEPGHNE